MQTLLKLDGSKLSDINRKVHPRPIRIQRMAQAGDGSLKFDYIATKMEFVISWGQLPENTADVPDSGLGMKALEAKCLDGASHTLVMYNQGGTPASYTGRIIDHDTPGMVERDSSAWWWEFELTFREA